MITLLNLPREENYVAPLAVEQFGDGEVVIIRAHAECDMHIYVPVKRIRALRDALTRALANLPPGSNA